jgi:hypothetical protein
LFLDRHKQLTNHPKQIALPIGTRDSDYDSGVIPVAENFASLHSRHGMGAVFRFLNTFCETPPETAFR